MFSVIVMRTHLSEWMTDLYLSPAMAAMASDDMKVGTAWTATTQRHSHSVCGPNGHFS